METLYATGIRHAEAHRLDLYDIDTAATASDCSPGQRPARAPGATDGNCITLALSLPHRRASGTRCRPALGQGQRRGQPKLIPPTSALWLAVHRPPSLVSNDRRPHPQLRSPVELKATVHHLPPLLRHASPAWRRLRWRAESESHVGVDLVVFKLRWRAVVARADAGAATQEMRGAAMAEGVDCGFEFNLESVVGMRSAII